MKKETSCFVITGVEETLITMLNTVVEALLLVFMQLVILLFAIKLRNKNSEISACASLPVKKTTSVFFSL